MKLFLFDILLFVLGSSAAMAQTEDSAAFAADRPGFATPPDVMSFRKVQLENGFQYINFFEGDVHRENFLFSSLLVRYGLLKFAELRIQTDFAYNITKDSAGPAVLYGLNPVAIGMKINLIGQQNVIPNISLLCNLTLPFIGKQEFLPKTFTPSLYLLMSNDLTQNLNLCYNYGLTWFGASNALTHFYAVCFNVQLPPKWSVFIEGYGLSELHSSSLYMDSGVAFLINDHLQLDFSASGSLTSITDFYLLGMGVAWRIPGRNKTQKVVSSIKPGKMF